MTAAERARGLPGTSLPAEDQASSAGRRLPGEAGIWAFIAGDLVIFSLLFATYLFYRGQQPALFVRSQHLLDQGLGVLNTVLMLSSSLFVALAMNAARAGMRRAPTRLYLLAAACGVAFGVVKVFEYGAKIRLGITINTNDMFMFYFILTGIHMLHVLIGISVLLFLASYTRSHNGVFAANELRNVESGSCFWHVVDLLWIILFALLYLARVIGMRTLFWSRTTAVWALLLLSTLVSWEMGHGLGFRSAAAAGVAIIVIAFVKVYLVLTEFMEVRHAPAIALWLARGWAIAVGLVLIALYLRIGQ